MTTTRPAIEAAERPPKAPATFAGYTEREWRAYAEGRYRFAVPPVCTWYWDNLSWMACIFGPRGGKA